MILHFLAVSIWLRYWILPAIGVSVCVRYAGNRWGPIGGWVASGASFAVVAGIPFATWKGRDWEGGPVPIGWSLLFLLIPFLFVGSVFSAPWLTKVSTGRQIAVGFVAYLFGMYIFTVLGAILLLR